MLFMARMLQQVVHWHKFPGYQEVEPAPACSSVRVRNVKRERSGPVDDRSGPDAT
jgi:hypothetical protein